MGTSIGTKVATASVAVVALLGAGLTTGAVSAPLPAHPTGSFELDRTTTYLVDPAGQGDQRAHIYIKQLSISDDTTAASEITREVDTGDGTGFRPWSSTTTTAHYVYDAAGEFVPRVRLTDVDGNQTAIDLPGVSVQQDTVAPTVTITSPRRALLHRAAGWRTVRGTAADAQSGLNDMAFHAFQRRNLRWFIYNFENDTWHRMAKGITKAKAVGKNYPTPYWTRPKMVAGKWTAPRLRGLSKGYLFVVAQASDNASRSTRLIRGVRLTR